MLREIHIRNYAVVEKLSVEFFPGFSVLSGETGSGKSILVDAVGLVLGGRASLDVIRTGQDRTTITAVFQCGDAARTWLEEFGLDCGEDLILRREIQAEGKSRLLVNDQPVTLASVRRLARRLVDIHGQNEHVALLARDVQLELLDQFANAQSSLEEVAQLYTRRRELGREMDELAQSEQERLRTLYLLQFQVQELNSARLEPDEDTRLGEEKRVLSNVEKLRTAATAAFENLYDEDHSALAKLAAAEKSVQELARYDSSAAAQLDLLASARALVGDTAASLRDFLAKLEADPARLEQVEDRLAEIARLKRKYGTTIEAILEYAKQAAAQLEKLVHADERRNQVMRQFEQASADYRRSGEALSAKRRSAAKSLEKRVRQELGQLGMEKAVFEIHLSGLSDAAGGPRGIDEVEMRFSANPGEEPRALERAASGGELSRLMLALKTIAADESRAGANGTRAHQGAAPNRSDLRTLIFDEVDAGIGGRVAECVGQRLKRLAANAQVLCVTHLAQIACFADCHYSVDKIERAGRTITDIRQLAEEKERAAEIARMLSGSQITGPALEHAAAMLKNAAKL